MQEKKCLKCEKVYQPKKTTSKFCSDSCRVMWNRGKEKKQKDVSNQVLINTILEKLSKVDFIPIPENGYDGKRFVGNSDEQSKYAAVAEEKTFQQHTIELSDLETEYEYKKKAAEIENAANLNRKQKDQLLASMRTSKF
jgi:predicted nucleic acid-binding Zn ribbon protein